MSPASDIAKKSRVEARDAILRAAHEEFSTHGFSGARVDRIARRAGFNKQLLYYYFSGKADLYRHVVEADYLGLRGQGSDLEFASLSPEAAITRLIDFLFTLVAQNRSSLRLLFDINTPPLTAETQSQAFHAEESPMIGMIEEVLRRGAAAGQFRSGVDPINLFLSVAGMAFLYLSGSAPLSMLCGRDLAGDAAVLDYRDHVQAVVLGGLRPPPSTV